MKNRYKKRNMICVLLALSWTLGLTVCASSENNGKSTSGTAVTDQTEFQEKEGADADQAETREEEMDTEPETGSGSEILVAYFSATSHTEGVAQKLADGLGADLYEIVPEQPYTAEDLDYGNSQSRTSLETDDPDARPAISGAVENMEQYEVVFLGYPIWWGNAPRIMSTFIESYDFDGKTIVPFCTSGSSGFGSSDEALREAAEEAVWLDGHRFSADASADDVMDWAESLELVQVSEIQVSE